MEKPLYFPFKRSSVEKQFKNQILPRRTVVDLFLNLPSNQRMFLVFQSTTYAIYSSVICFYIPLILIVGIYIKLFMIGRKRFRQKIRRAFELVEINELTRTNTDRHSPEDQTSGRFREHPTAMSEGFTDISPPKTHNLDRQKSLSIPEEHRIVKHIVQGSKRRQILPAILFKMEPNINPS